MPTSYSIYCNSALDTNLVLLYVIWSKARQLTENRKQTRSVYNKGDTFSTGSRAIKSYQMTARIYMLAFLAECTWFFLHRSMILCVKCFWKLWLIVIQPMTLVVFNHAYGVLLVVGLNQGSSNYGPRASSGPRVSSSGPLTVFEFAW